MADADVVVEHPNRRKAASRVTRLIVIGLLLASAALVTIISVGGWDTLEGAKPLQVVFILIYLVLALFVFRWSRGVLAMSAGFAVFLMIFAVVAAPSWFDRDAAGFTNPALSSDVLGLLCVLLAIVQAVLILFAMSGFRQRWNVEAERPREPADPAPREPRETPGGAEPAPA
jgi:lysylphosphatidylglycerol synthetase-like protein (DUF2156 family)